MRKSLIFSLALFCVFSVFASPNQRSPQWANNQFRILERHASESGNIPLVLGDEGFYVHVDFADHHEEASQSDSSDADTGDMVLALYTDQTFFGKYCQGFDDYCQKYPDTCSKTIGNETNMTFPYFSSSCKPITPKIFLDYNYWYLDSMAFISTACPKGLGGYNVGGYGILGMGISDFSKQNFKKKSTFSIQITKNLANGTLAFNIDLSQAKSKTPAAQLSSDNFWHISNVESITMKDNTFNVNASIIFDVGSDSIGFPQDIHTQVLNWIGTDPSVGGCSIGDDFLPICNFTGDIRNLPSILINVGSQQVEIPPEVYVVQTQDDYFYYDPITLKLKVLATDPTQGAYVTPDYENYIILGYPAMSYYYSVFEAGHNEGGSISLYYSKEYVKASDLTWIFVLVGVFGLVIIGVIYYMFERRSKKKVTDEPLIEPQQPVKVKAKAVRRLH